MTGTLTLHLESTHMEQMRAWVMALAPEEACGLLAGLDGRVFQVIGVENELHSHSRYRMKPSQQLKALIHFEEQGWELLAIFHSHPGGPPIPSPTDIAEAYYPEAAHLIWSPIAGEWQCRAFTIVNSHVQAVALIVQAPE